MAFGPIMGFAAKDNLEVELAPFAKEDVKAFISPGLQQASIFRYLGRQTAPVLDDEYEWYDKIRTDTKGFNWGIWVKENDERKLIGVSALDAIEYKPVPQAISGSLIFDQGYWRRGIASSAHKARTWYGFNHMGLVRIRSEVIQGNNGSRKALEHSGYVLHSVERNIDFFDGCLRHKDNLECLNPANWAWRQWWGTDRPTVRAKKARVIAQSTMTWAEENVTLL